MEGTDVVKEFLTGQGLAADPNVAEPPQNTEPPAATPPANTEPPKVDPPSGTEPPANAEPPVPTPIELSDDQKLFAINQHFGTAYTSLADAGKVKEEWSEVSNLRDYKSKYEELQATPRFKPFSSTIDELNKFAHATGIEDSSVIKRFKRFENTADKDPIEAIVLDKILKKPSLAEDIDDLRLSIQDKYRLKINTEDLDGEELERAEKTMRLAQFSLKQDAEDAMASIASVSEKAKNYIAPDDQSTLTNKATQEANQAQWKATLSNKAIKDLFTSIPVQVSLGKDSEGKEIFETANTIHLTPQEVDEVIQFATEVAVGNNLTPTPEVVNEIVKNQLNIIRMQRYEETAVKFAQSYSAKKLLEMEKAAHNPSGVGKIETPVGEEKPKEVDILSAIDRFQKTGKAN